MKVRRIIIVRRAIRVCCCRQRVKLACIKPFVNRWLVKFGIAIDNQVLVEKDRPARVEASSGCKRPTTDDHIYALRCVLKQPASFANRDVPAKGGG